MRKKHIVLFASGSGSNVENIVRYFQADDQVGIACVLSNRKNAYVLDRCDKLNINALYFNKTAFYTSDLVLEILNSIKPDLIVLAGFLWKMPGNIIDSFPNKIINIHPALLPKYGGKGMYGMAVHRAVKENGDPESGITIHYVNENYDDGAIIHQAKVAVLPNDTPETIAAKVHKLEYEYFPKIIDRLLRG